MNMHLRLFIKSRHLLIDMISVEKASTWTTCDSQIDRLPLWPHETPTTQQITDAKTSFYRPRFGGHVFVGTWRESRKDNCERDVSKMQPKNWFRILWRMIPGMTSYDVQFLNLVLIEISNKVLFELKIAKS